jgi:prolyl-tRNA synthetase
MGFPIRITVGKKVKDGQVEIRVRKTKEVTTIAISDAVKFASDYIRSNTR